MSGSERRAKPPSASERAKGENSKKRRKGRTNSRLYLSPGDAYMPHLSSQERAVHDEQSPEKMKSKKKITKKKKSDSEANLKRISHI